MKYRSYRKVIFFVVHIVVQFLFFFVSFSYNNLNLLSACYMQVIIIGMLYFVNLHDDAMKNAILSLF